jgi:DNA-binding NarL/FixJ family response regulator
MIRIAIHGGTLVQVNGLKAALRGDGGFHVMPACLLPGTFAAMVARDEPDLILIEPAPGVTSIYLRELQRQAPAARIVLWVDTFSTKMAVEAMVMGLRGILRKSLPSDLQLNCLRKVQAGDLWFEKALTGPVAEPRAADLTAPERSLMDLLSQGLKNREIAVHLAVSEAEVKVYLSRLFEKLGVRDRFELALLGLRKAGRQSCEAERAFGSGSGGTSGDAAESFAMPMLPTLQ